MSFIQAVILGIVQGLTEFLPISSTAHLRIVPAVLDWHLDYNPDIPSDPGAAFTAVIQLGTTLAIVLYFWRELWAVVRGWFRGLVNREARAAFEYRMGWYLIFATIPVGVFGLIFKDQIETGARNLWIIAAAMIALAVVLFAAERVGSRTRGDEQLNTTDAAVVGGAQALALIPGSSRSGVTITAGLFRGLERETAARFSFLLSVPAVVLSGLFEAYKHAGDKNVPGAGVTITATIVSFVVGFAAIAWLMRYIARHTTFIFIWYRVALGALLIVLLSTGVLHATK